MSAEKKVVIRLMAETQLEKTKSAIAVFKRLKSVTRHADRSVYSLGRSYKQYKAAQEHATKAQKDGNKTIKRLRDSQASLRHKLKESDKAYKKYTKAVKAATKAKKNFNKQVGKTAGALAGAGALKGISKGAAAGKAALGKLLMVAQRVGIVLAGAVTAGSYAFMNLYDEVAKIRIVMDKNFDSMVAYMDKFQEMSERSIFSAHELAKAGFEIGATMGDISSEELRKIADLSQTMAIASGFGDATTAAQLLMTTYRQFGDSTGDTTEQMKLMSAILFKAGADTALSVQDIGTAMQFVGGTAASMEQEVQNVLAALGMLRNAGLSASVASTSLNMVLTNLASPSQEADMWMRRLGISVTDTEGNIKEITDVAKEVTQAFDAFTFRDKAEEFEVLSEMFGVRGARSMTIFMKNIRENEDAMHHLADSFLDVEKGFELMEASARTYMTTPQAQMKTMIHTVKNLGVSLGEAFLMEETAGGEKQVAGWITTLQEFLKSTEVKSFIDSLGKMFKHLATHIMPIVIKAFKVFGPLIIKALYMVLRVIGDPRFQEFMDMLLSIAGILGDKLLDAFQKLLPSLMRLLPLFTKLLPIFELFLIQLDMIVPIIQMLVAVFEILAPAIGFVIEGVKLFGWIFAQVASVIVSIVNGILEAIMLLVEGLGELTSWFTGDTTMRDWAHDIRMNLQDARSAMEDFQNTTYGDYTISPTAQGDWGVGRNTYNTEITVESVNDEDTIDKIEEEIVRSYRGSGANYTPGG